MKILLTTLNSKHIHSNLALKYLYAVSADAVKGAVMELRSSPSIIRMITYTGNCSGRIRYGLLFLLYMEY